MRILRPRLKISVYTRFMIANTFILIFLVGSILFLIERREVRTIFEESKSRGILTARNIANLNLESLTFWDAVGVKGNIGRKDGAEHRDRGAGLRGRVAGLLGFGQGGALARGKPERDPPDPADAHPH